MISRESFNHIVQHSPVISDSISSVNRAITVSQTYTRSSIASLVGSIGVSSTRSDVHHRSPMSVLLTVVAPSFLFVALTWMLMIVLQQLVVWLRYPCHTNHRLDSLTDSGSFRCSLTNPRQSGPLSYVGTLTSFWMASVPIYLTHGWYTLNCSYYCVDSHFDFLIILDFMWSD